MLPLPRSNSQNFVVVVNNVCYNIAFFSFCYDIRCTVGFKIFKHKAVFSKPSVDDIDILKHKGVAMIQGCTRNVALEYAYLLRTFPASELLCFVAITHSMLRWSSNQEGV